MKGGICHICGGYSAFRIDIDTLRQVCGFCERSVIGNFLPINYPELREKIREIHGDNVANMFKKVTSVRIAYLPNIIKLEKMREARKVDTINEILNILIDEAVSEI